MTGTYTALFPVLLFSISFSSRLRGAGDLMITSSVNGAIDLESPAPFRLPFATIVDVEPVVIDASCGQVWQALLDFPSYSDWNAFVPSVNVSDTLPRVGSSVSMQVKWSAVGLKYFPDSFQTEFVSAMVTDAKADLHAIAYGGAMGLSALMAFERVQFLRPPPTPPTSGAQRRDQRERCIYKTFDRFGGILNPLTDWLFGKGIHDGFALAQTGLKEYVEAKASGRPTPNLRHTTGEAAHTEL